MMTASDEGAAAAGQRRGLIEASSRVLAALLRSPRLQRSVRLLLRDIDADNAPLLVRALLDSEPALVVDLAAAAPRMANAAAGAGDELLRRLLDLPRSLVAAVVGQAARSIDGRQLGALSARAWLLTERVIGEPSIAEGAADLARDLAAGFDATLAATKPPVTAGPVPSTLTSRAASWLGDAAADQRSLTGRGVSALAGAIRSFGQQPRFVQLVIGPLVDAAQQAWREAWRSGAAQEEEHDG